MLITREGNTVGSVSGGCLEHDLIEKAEQVIELGQPNLLHYDTAHPEAGIGRALKGCGGDVSILVQPLNQDRLNLLAACLAKSAADNSTRVMATIIEANGTGGPKIGDQLVLCGDEIEFSDINSKPLIDAITEDTETVAESGRSVTKTYTQNNLEVEVFIERFQTPTSVLIIGADDVAFSLTAFANELGWSSTVVDHRAGLANKKRFPHSECLTLESPSELKRQVKLEQIDAAVILTHICQADLEYLNQLIPSPLEYIGLLGSRGRVGGLLGQLEHPEASLGRQSDDRIHAPVGLDIGAEDPPEIALSIISEIQAVLAGKSAGSLKNRAHRTLSKAEIE